MMIVHRVAEQHRALEPDVPITITWPDELRLAMNGPGIAPEDLPKVFDRYLRADQSNGTGIGLALVKQIADAHGENTVQSPLAGQQHGTRFVMSFTRAE